MAKAEKRGAEAPLGKLFCGRAQGWPSSSFGFGILVSDCSRFRGFEVWIWGLVGFRSQPLKSACGVMHVGDVDPGGLGSSIGIQTLAFF